MNRQFKIALTLECIIGACTCFLYKLFIAPMLAAKHDDSQIFISLFLLICSLFLTFISYVYSKSRLFQKGFLLWFFGFASLFSLLFLLISMTTGCPVCDSPYF